MSTVSIRPSGPVQSSPENIAITTYKDLGGFSNKAERKTSSLDLGEMAHLCFLYLNCRNMYI
ncbi:hypothetical protein Hanom_Chr11g01012201 [Helianthus anomalus]